MGITSSRQDDSDSSFTVASWIAVCGVASNMDPDVQRKIGRQSRVVPHPWRLSPAANATNHARGEGRAPGSVQAPPQLGTEAIAFRHGIRAQESRRRPLVGRAERHRDPAPPSAAAEIGIAVTSPSREPCLFTSAMSPQTFTQEAPLAIACI